MNIFEGGRRIAKVVAGAWAVGLTIGALNGAFTYQSGFDGSLVAKEGLGGLAFIWVFTWGVGWIVRGFMGIPRGQDKKPPAAGGSQ